MDSPVSCGGSVAELAGHRAAPACLTEATPDTPSAKTLAWAPDITSTCKKQTQDLKHWNNALAVANRKHRG